MSELIDTMKEAQAEIRDLRRRNELLSAKVEVMDSFMCVLNTCPAIRMQGASPDVVHALQRHIEEVERVRDLPRAEEHQPEVVSRKSPVDKAGGGRYG